MLTRTNLYTCTPTRLACLAALALFSLSGAGCMSVVLLLSSKKGSDQWHQEMSLCKHLDVVEQNFAVGEPIRETRRTLRKLGVQRRPVDRSPDWVKSIQDRNPAAGGVPRLIASLYPPYGVSVWRPTYFYFHFDNDNHLLEVWAESIPGDGLSNELQSLIASDPDFAAIMEPTANGLGGFYVRVLPVDSRIGDLPPSESQEQ